ncbi:MAG: tyrosine-type recombinase/integrase [Clostridia bacterium]
MPKKQKDGRYRTKLVVSPTEKPVWVSGRTLREFEENKRLARERYIEGVKPRDITFHAVVIEWFTVMKMPRIKSAATLNSYQNAINLHLLPYFPDKQLLRAVRRADLQMCLDALKGRSSTQSILLLSVMRHVMAYAMAERMISIDPSAALTMPDVGHPEGKGAFSDAQEDRLLKTAASEPDGLMLYVLYYLGCRRGEMLGLKWGDVDWDNRMIHIQRTVDFNVRKSSPAGSRGDHTKTAASNRWVPLPEELAAILRPLRSLPHMYIFTTKDNQPIKDSAFRTRWTRLMLAAGYATVSQTYAQKVAKWQLQGKPVIHPNLAFDYDVSVTSHWFRHNYITACVLAGVPAEVTMRIVGHTDYRTTINIYTHVQDAQLRKATVSLAGVLRGASCQKVASMITTD